MSINGNQHSTVTGMTFERELHIAQINVDASKCPLLEHSCWTISCLFLWVINLYHNLPLIPVPSLIHCTAYFCSIPYYHLLSLRSSELLNFVHIFFAYLILYVLPTPFFVIEMPAEYKAKSTNHAFSLLFFKLSPRVFQTVSCPTFIFRQR
jgi:hypothetical protein